MRAMPGSPWPGRDDELRELWAEGVSTAEIARRMGLTKNSVIGRAHRLRLPGRASPIRTGCAGAPKVRRAKRPGGAAAVLFATRSQRDAVGGAAEAEVRPTAPAETAATPRPGPSVPRAAAHGVAHGVPAPASQRAGTPLGARSCQFPMWPDGAVRGHPAFGWICGKPSARGSYCAAHAERCFARVCEAA